MCDQQRLRPACAYAQADQSICWSLKYSMSVKLLTEHHLEFLTLKRGCTGSSESTLVKMPHCWKPHVATQILYSECLKEMYLCDESFKENAKISNQYNQVPHLTRDTILERETSHTRELRGQSFPSRWSQGCNGQIRQYNKDKRETHNNQSTESTDGDGCI